MAIDPMTAASLVQGGIGLIQGLIGNGQQRKANRRLKRLLSQRELYKTQDETFDAYDMALNAAQGGYSPETLNYLTDKSNNALSAGLGATRALGGDPNDVMNLFNASVDNLLRIGAEDDERRYRNFTQLYNAMGNLAQSKDAEFADRQALWKDQVALEAQRAQAGAANLQSGLNMGLSALTNWQTGQMYKDAQPNNTDYINATMDLYNAQYNNGRIKNVSGGKIGGIKNVPISNLPMPNNQPIGSIFR